MQDNIIQLDKHRPLGHDPLPSDTEKDGFFPWPSTELPQDTEEPEFEYTGDRKTLATYSIMNDPKGWVVLCHVPITSRYHPFVTWYYNAETNSYCHGNYFDNEIEARNDFKVRINRLEPTN